MAARLRFHQWNERGDEFKMAQAICAAWTVVRTVLPAVSYVRGPKLAQGDAYLIEVVVAE